jgi:hypothetical protein
MTMEGETPAVMTPQIEPDDLHEAKQSFTSLLEWDSIDTNETFLDWTDQSD